MLSFVRSFVHSFVHFVGSFVRPFVCAFRSFVRASVRAFDPSRVPSLEVSSIDRVDHSVRSWLFPFPGCRSFVRPFRSFRLSSVFVRDRLLITLRVRSFRL